MKSGTASMKSLTCVDERRDHEEADAGQHEEREREHERRRIPAAHAAALERLHSRVQRGGEQRRDEDPGQDVPGQEDEQEHEPDEHGDPEDEEDRPRTHGHDAHLGGRHQRPMFVACGETSWRAAACYTATAGSPASASATSSSEYAWSSSFPAA